MRLGGEDGFKVICERGYRRRRREGERGRGGRSFNLLTFDGREETLRMKKERFIERGGGGFAIKS